MSKAKTKTGTTIAKAKPVAGMIPKNLAELRTKFDGLRDVAEKFEDGVYKTQMLNHVEDLYLATGNWFAKIQGSPIEA